MTPPFKGRVASNAFSVPPKHNSGAPLTLRATKRAPQLRTLGQEAGCCVFKLRKTTQGGVQCSCPQTQSRNTSPSRQRPFPERLRHDLPFIFINHVAGLVCSDFFHVDAIAFQDLDHLPDPGNVLGSSYRGEDFLAPSGALQVSPR